MADTLQDQITEKYRAAVTAGVEPLRVRPPSSLSQWMNKHFYKSAETSQGEGAWECWPFQTVIADCMGFDQIIETDLMKASRMGFTKIETAAVGYFAEEKRRNQAVYLPTDGDMEIYSKQHLDGMFRDVPAMRKIFPDFMSRNKRNTIDSKIMLGCMLHVKGGETPSSYATITVAAIQIDEADLFPNDIKGEGDPITLAYKRLEGATFPKMNIASSPRRGKAMSHIANRCAIAKALFTFQIPCPHCNALHPLTWGGKADKKESHGFVWESGKPYTVRHACPVCGTLYSQAEYLGVWQRGVYKDDETGMTAHPGPVFKDAEGLEIQAPDHVAFVDVWTGYSPQVSWPKIVEEYLAALADYRHGRPEKMKTFTNTTLAQCWEEDEEKGDAEELTERAKRSTYAMGTVPKGVLVLLQAWDVQGDRFEGVTWGIGQGEEMWLVDYVVIRGVNPYLDADWEQIMPYADKRYPCEGGGTLTPELIGVDTGYATHPAYRFVRLKNKRRWFATKGDGADALPIKGRSRLQDVRTTSGTTIKSGVTLWRVGTDSAKDTLWGKLKVEAPGPSYVHFPKDTPKGFFEQLVSEVRVRQRNGEYKWMKPTSSTRNEALDCTGIVLFLLEILVTAYKGNVERMWQMLARNRVQVDIMDVADEVPAAAAIAKPQSKPAQPAAAKLPALAKPPVNPSTWSAGFERRT